MPQRPVIKRVRSRRGDGWELVSDNRAAGGDSASHGVADVVGVVVLRWQPGRWLPRRIQRRSEA
jgi:hypothetical protein